MPPRLARRPLHGLGRARVPLLALLLLVVVAVSGCAEDCSSDPTTIAVVGGTIFVHGKDGYLYALAASTGAVRWATKVWGDLSTYREVVPVASATSVFIADGQSVAALRTGTGDLEWRVTVRDVRTIFHLGVDQDMVYTCAHAGTGSTLVALKSQDGTPLWRSTVSTEPYGAAAQCSTIISIAGLVVLAGPAKVLALDRSSGAKRWEYTPVGIEQLWPPAMLDNTLYLSRTDYTITALSLADGAVQFQTTLPPLVVPTPTAPAGATPQLSPIATSPSETGRTPDPTAPAARGTPSILFISPVFAAERHLYVATWQGIFALDARTGASRTVMRNPAGGQIFFSIKDRYLIYRTSSGDAAGPTYIVTLPEETVLPPSAPLPQLVDYHPHLGGFPEPCSDEWRYRNTAFAVDLFTSRPIWTVDLYKGSVRPSTE
jgi:outer membrane protein assembly factor BamB